jgi:hypothetical protein
MAGLAQSMSGGMGGLIPMAFKRRDDDSRPPPLAMGAIQSILPRKKDRPVAPTIASGSETSSY